MQRRILTAGRLLMVLSLCLALGLHWAALQSIAWAGMLVSYSQSGGIAQAVAKTFDGKHPCPLCRAIGKEQGGKKPDSQSVTGKFDMEYRAVATLLPPPSHDFRWSIDSLTAAGYSPEPTVPPPQAA